MSGAARIATVLKRDWWLFWPLTAGVAVWQILQRATLEPDDAGVSLSLILGTLTREPPMRYVPLAASWLSMLAIATLIIVLVQEDDIPGPRGDWLTRPVKRFETLAAKALFVLAGVTFPGFIAGVVYALVQDAPLDVALLHAAGRTVGDLISFTLPIFLLASMTSNVAEAAIIALIGLGASYLFLPSSFGLGGGMPPVDSGWFVTVLRRVLLLTLTAPLIVWQYRRPNRWIVRGAITAALVGWIALDYYPRTELARVNLALSPDPAAGASVVLPMDKPVDQAVLDRLRPCPPRQKCGPSFALPRAEGVSDDALVQLDESRLHVLDSAGKQLGSLIFSNYGPALAVGSENVLDAKKRKQFEALTAGLREGRYRGEGDLVLTLLEPGQRFDLPNDGKRHFLPGLGSCRARFSEDTPNTIQMMCRQIGTAPNFIVASLQGGAPPRRCAADVPGSAAHMQRHCGRGFSGGPRR